MTAGVVDAAPRGDAVVELLGVSKEYTERGGETVRALDDISVRIEEGEFFSLLGPSGCGKTTTLRLIAGFEQPTAGRVRLDGADVAGLPPYKRDVNTVFQNYALFPHMKVRDNVGYPLKMKGVDKDEARTRVMEALERVEMTKYADRRPHQMSGGQRQRIALARALVGRPKLVLLDEPLGALDLKLRESMLVVLKHLQRDSGITFVYVTHDQSEALAMSDRIAVMHGGRIEQVAPPAGLYRAPTTAFVAGFIGKTNLLPCTRVSERVARAGALDISLSEPCDETDFVVSVRPDDIVVGPASGDLTNTYRGIVSDVLFLGHECDLIVEAGGQRLIMRVAGRSALVPGDEVQFGWSGPDGRVVRTSPGV
jgi:spermidine/putrescine transport system ATP-binding protein